MMGRSRERFCLQDRAKFGWMTCSKRRYPARRQYRFAWHSVDASVGAKSPPGVSADMRGQNEAGYGFSLAA
jgi:hypothetical protein